VTCAIKAALEPFAIPFVVNDRVDVALAAQADGVHIGPKDMAPEDARALLGLNAIIGVSIKRRRGSRGGAGRGHQLCGRRRCLRDAVEQKSPPIGPEGFSRIAQALRRRAPDLPIVGIAAIDAGADGVAVISALSLADDPAAVARALREIVDGMLAKRGT
jgi:thiamine-phosphate pyrophosphorylase